MRGGCVAVKPVHKYLGENDPAVCSHLLIADPCCSSELFVFVAGLADEWVSICILIWIWSVQLKEMSGLPASDHTSMSTGWSWSQDLWVYSRRAWGWERRRQKTKTFSLCCHWLAEMTELIRLQSLNMWSNSISSCVLTHGVKLWGEQGRAIPTPAQGGCCIPCMARKGSCAVLEPGSHLGKLKSQFCSPWNRAGPSGGRAVKQGMGSGLCTAKFCRIKIIIQAFGAGTAQAGWGCSLCLDWKHFLQGFLSWHFWFMF